MTDRGEAANMTPISRSLVAEMITSKARTAENLLTDHSKASESSFKIRKDIEVCLTFPLDLVSGLTN